MMCGVEGRGLELSKPSGKRCRHPPASMSSITQLMLFMIRRAGDMGRGEDEDMGRGCRCQLSDCACQDK